MTLNEELVRAAAREAFHAFDCEGTWENCPVAHTRYIAETRAAIEHYLAHRSLPDRMREAAPTLREASELRFGPLSNPERSQWSAVQLVELADQWEAADAAQAEQDALVDEIAAVTLQSSCGTEVDLGRCGPVSADLHRGHARALLAKFDITRREQS